MTKNTKNDSLVCLTVAKLSNSFILKTNWKTIKYIKDEFTDRQNTHKKMAFSRIPADVVVAKDKLVVY